MNLLNVGRVPVHPMQKSELKVEQQPEPKKYYVTMFWTKVKELRLTNEEASQIITQFSGNFEKAYTEITSPF